MLLCAFAVPAIAQPKRPLKGEKTDQPKPAETKKPVKEQNFNMDGFNLNGRNRSPQLLYFLERANEELERASLEKRSFIPHIVRSMDEEAL